MKKKYVVRLTLMIFLSCLTVSGQKTVAQLKAEFDLAWAESEGRAELMAYANSDGSKQEYYYANWNLNGVINMWQATGDVVYFNDAKEAIDAMISNSVDITIDGVVYKGWPGSLEGNEYPVGFELWDSMIWKEVATLLRIMFQSDSLSTSQQSWFDYLLNWTEKNIWERYENKFSYGAGGEDGNLFTYTPEDTSHWARIAMELYLITKKAKYKSFFDRASFAGCSTCVETLKGFSMRDQLYDNTSVTPTAYGMYLRWGVFNNDTDKFDSPHFAAFIQFVALAYENDMYWNKTDVEKLISTVNNVIWKSDVPLAGSYYIDGTGTVDGYPIYQGAQAILGRFDESFQLRLEASTTEGWNKGHRIGLIAANRAILNNQKRP